uniref:BPTI/Kunitz inhibitor domain-containing protein n=1 Tax=Mesocestoides corti TaxID=53468 RepID=A0A5K3F6A2_MESCO
MIAVLALVAICLASFTEAITSPCYLPIERGMCMAHMKRWAYDATTGLCVPFVYGGCGGNANQFKSKAACRKVCKGM